MKIMHYIESSNVSFRVPWIDLMKELEREGVEQALLCRPGGNMEEVAMAHNIKTYTWKPAITNFPPANLEYLRLIRQIAPDIVHTRLSSAANIAGFWGKWLKIPTISMLDGPYKKKYYRNADHFTACSQWVKDSMVAQGTASDIIDVIYNSIEVEKYRRGKIEQDKAKQEFRQQHGIHADEKVFIGAGSFAPVKGFDILIKAFDKLLRTNENTLNAKLVIVGDGPLRDTYAQLIRDFEIEDRVILSSGYAKDIRPWLWGADYFVLPSRSEPFGIIVLEAMASGLCVIATQSGGPSEIITDGLNGFLVPAEDTSAMAAVMKKTLQMGAQAEENMREEAQKRLACFTNKAQALRQMTVYKKVLANY